MNYSLKILRNVGSLLYDDANDVDDFGMDQMTRKRLRVKELGRKLNGRAKKEKIPSRIPTYLNIKEGVLRRRRYLYELKRFRTKGIKPGEQDAVGYVMTKFYNSVPDFDRSVVEIDRRVNSFSARGSWPSSGRQVFDWDLEVWGERGGAVVVKLNMWSSAGRSDGETFRTTVATVDRLIPKFVSKYYGPIKDRMKKEAGVRIGRIL